ncbi:MAG: hypothetical protein NTZ39_04860 [Methanoregula sp.]|nr:hypothetical protein [Methanoregula sp.]
MPTRHYALLVLALLACVSLFAMPVFAASTTSSLSGDDALTRGSRFTISITGIPNTQYYVWLTRTWSLSGNPGDQPPVVVGYQANVQQDPSGGPFTIGTYAYNNGNGRTILDDVAPSSATLSNTSYYALVTTDSAGTAVVAFQTSLNTALQSYSVRVENPTSANNDTLLVRRADTTIKRGTVSIEVGITPNPPRISPPQQTPVTSPITEVKTEIPTVLQSVVPPTEIPTQRAPLELSLSIFAMCLGVWMIRNR